MTIKDLKLKKPIYKDQVELYIQGDENDADYISETSTLSLEEFERVLPYLKKLKKNGGLIEDHSYSKVDLTEEEIEKVSEYFPRTVNDDAQIHDITDIQAWFLNKADSIRYEIKI